MVAAERVEVGLANFTVLEELEKHGHFSKQEFLLTIAKNRPP